MPSKRQSSNKRAQGGGRNPNSEPRLQVFRDFNGVNFELADDVDLTEYDADQTDLQMNYMFLQNNVATMSNKTMETRDDVVELFKAPGHTSFLGPTCLVGDTLYASRTMDAKVDGHIGIANLPDEGDAPVTMDDYLTLDNNTGSTHTWLSFEHYDDKLIGMTAENELWTMDLNADEPVMSNAQKVPDPDDFSEDPDEDYRFHNDRIVPKGTLVKSDTMTDECPFRVEIAYSWVNKYGPTKVSSNTVVYFNHPVSEWHAGCYLRLYNKIPQGFDIKAVELYYSTDNAMSLLFLGRVDLAANATAWMYDWYGYVDATSMWPIANLIAPTENLTKGVHASRVKAIDGRLYFWGDEDNPQRLYMGGNPGNLLSISSGTGGGFVDVEPGTNQAVRYVDKYKTQSGNSIVTMLCDSPNSHREQRYNLVENTIALSNEQSMKSWQAEQVAGAVGCKSYDGAVVCADGLYSVSRYGLALTTMTMEYNAQIRTNYVSEQIKPVFTDVVEVGQMLRHATVLELDGIIYMAFCAPGPGAPYGPNDVLFCYDINLKAWWTHSVPSTILGLFHIDSDEHREGIGIVTPKSIYMLPTTQPDDHDSKPDHDFLIQTGEISTQMPQQGWQYLSQLEFHYDYLIGDVEYTVRMIDIFGREIVAKKTVSEDEYQHNYVVRMRIDQKVMSYVIEMRGTARFRLTHFLARVYVMSNKIGQVWGFDDSLSHRSSGRIHPTFKCYNDVRKAIFT